MSPNYKIQKVLKKQNRCRAIISKECNIESSEQPTKYLAILNAGLSTGLTQERVIAEVTKYGEVEQLHMLPGKSYAFMVCTTATQAELIFSGLHNKATLGQDYAIVYMSYFDAIPRYTSPWIREPPAGLILLKEFVTESEERSLLKVVEVARESKQENSKNGTLKHREVIHFGYEFMYQNNNVNPECPLERQIPKECDVLWERLKNVIEDNDNVRMSWKHPDQLTVNVYASGQGIPPHVDTHSAFLDPIMSLSLESDVVMDFKRGQEHFSLLLPRRSLLIMSGEARYDWIHGIATRTMDVIPSSTALTTQKRSKRTSFTFRKLRGGGACDCRYPTLCDSRQTSYSNSKETSAKALDDVAVQLETNNVHAIYDKIADHFSETRHKPWPLVAEFVDSFECGSILLDIGCGNGKYLYNHPNILKLGCDRSAGLLSVCSLRHQNIFQCNCISVPIRSNSVDGCISIAVIHHLATPARRLIAIKEMTRVLTTDGRALIYVWARDQQSNSKKSSYLRQNKAVNKEKVTEDEQRQQTTLQLQQQLGNTSPLNLPIHTNRTAFLQQDLLVPWKLKTSTESAPNDTTFLRYYHVFENEELQDLVRQLPQVEILRSYYDQGNHCVIFKKK